MATIRCKHCNAEVYWDISLGALKCDYCGGITNPEEFNFDTTTTEFENEYYEKTYKCNQCGAILVVGDETLSSTCAYCGSALVIDDITDRKFNPKLVIPFTVSKEQAKQYVTDYLNKSSWIPKFLRQKKHVENIRGVYLPYWLHSFTYTGALTFDCCTTIRTYNPKRGPTRYLREKTEVDIIADTNIERMPCDASKGFDNKLSSTIEPFNYQDMRPYNPGYLAGFYAEVYGEKKRQQIMVLKQRCQKAMRNTLCRDLNKYEYVALSRAEDNLLDITAEYAMMPVWLLDIEHKGKIYTFAVNGNTGKVAGELPLDKWRLALVAGILPILCFLFMLQSGAEHLEDTVEWLKIVIITGVFIFTMLKVSHKKKQTQEFGGEHYMQHTATLPDVNIKYRNDISLGREWETDKRVDERNAHYQHSLWKNLFTL